MDLLALLANVYFAVDELARELKEQSKSYKPVHHERQFEKLTQRIAFDGSGHLVVADCLNHVQVLKYRNGARVRTIGSEGSSAGQLHRPTGVAVDGDGRIVMCDTSNSRLKVLL